MAVAQRMTVQDYERFVMTGVEGAWELHDGVLVEKPGMSAEHGDFTFEFGFRLRSQIDRSQFRIAINDWRVLRPTATVFIPDLVVVPIALFDELRGQPGRLAIFSRPLPLVVAVWSASTGDYDIATKIPVYQQRGDLEIWHVHPYERTLTRWAPQPDGSYRTTTHRNGIIRPISLPGVVIDLDGSFAD